jgi:hypothetical protein
MSRYPTFDRSNIELRSLGERGHELRPSDVWSLNHSFELMKHPEWPSLIDAIVAARASGRPVILMMGAHPIKLGLSRFIIDLIERNLVTLVATNGAGIIHDYELATGVGTSEDVPRWIQAGQFGLWQETGKLNDMIAEGAKRGEGLGETVGRVITELRLPCRELSIAAAGWRKGIPITSHVGIGCDITHAHANCDGAALGQASLTDFLIFARAIQDLEGGLYLNIGSAVTGPEVYLKALSMARNVGRQQGREIRRFTTAVFDLADLPADYRAGPPGKDHPLYYYRPWKTILVRTVADGGHSFFFAGDHRRTLPSLWNDCVARWNAVTKIAA